MQSKVKIFIALLLITVSLAACASSPETPQKTGPSADDQRSRAKQAQDELYRDTSR